MHHGSTIQPPQTCPDTKEHSLGRSMSEPCRSVSFEWVVQLSLQIQSIQFFSFWVSLQPTYDIGKAPASLVGLDAKFAKRLVYPKHQLSIINFRFFQSALISNRCSEKGKCFMCLDTPPTIFALFVSEDPRSYGLSVL